MNNISKAPLELVAGFLPLLDCALLVAAREKGFAHAQGVDLHLLRDLSWAAVRDRLAIGGLDAAQTPAPLPIATSLGLGSLKVDMIAPMALGHGGNAITISNAIVTAMSAHATLDGDPARTGAGLEKALAHRRETGQRQAIFAVVHPFSSHNYELRYWLASCGIAPDSDVQIVVLPPPFLPDALASGQIDGYCVGEPWNSMAVARGIGQIVTTKARIWPASLEKVLSLRADMDARKPKSIASLVRALAEASQWCGEPANIEELADLLAKPAYLDMPAKQLLPGLTGLLPTAYGQSHEPDFLNLGAGSTYPWRQQAIWLYAQMVRWGQTQFSEYGLARAASVFRPDLYEAATGAGAPYESPPLTQIFDGASFDPADVQGYIAGVATQDRPQKRRDA
jgi:ABC-type nitrate/sulfonate/bicarbonate transport system substrate-binding protein